MTDNPNVVALDCEMVGVGPNGCKSRLGRVSIVDYDGKVLLDMYCKPVEPITDYRTRWSGLTKRDLQNAEPIKTTVKVVKSIIEGKIVVGHAIKNDLDVLDITIPAHRIRDTQKYQPLKTICERKGGKGSKLKIYARYILGMSIQFGEHDSVEDARATMNLYKHVEKEWEEELQEDTGNILFTPMGFLAFLFLVAVVTRNVTLFFFAVLAIYLYLTYA